MGFVGRNAINLLANHNAVVEFLFQIVKCISRSGIAFQQSDVESGHVYGLVTLVIEFNKLPCQVVLSLVIFAACIVDFADNKRSVDSQRSRKRDGFLAFDELIVDVSRHNSTLVDHVVACKCSVLGRSQFP